MKRPFIVMSIDTVYPFFCGAVASAWLCFFSVVPQFENRTGISFRKPAVNIPLQSAHSEVPRNMTQTALPFLEVPIPAFSHYEEEQEDAILAAYRDEVQKQWVTTFFARVVKPADLFPGATTMEMAAAILSNASAFNISPSLAFALCWAESRFNPLAVNRTNDDGSIDRGLFQLNNRSFPQLNDVDFFTPSINAYYGMTHLRWCLDTGGSVVAGLAMYNAGTGRVKAEGAPKRTLDYVSYILGFQRKIEDAFADHPFPASTAEELASEPAGFDLPESAKAELYFGKPRLSLLTPIAGRL
jgi:hypothetical protein